MNNHTAGPWTTRLNGCWVISSKAIENNGPNPYFSTLAMVTQRDPNPVHGGGISEETAKANAHLIAAAPELLEQCIILCNAIESFAHDPVGSWPEVIIAKNIINKATVQESPL
jgi:hypothetical protein